jgi:tetratricopeptide (TPR) repeat protein
MTRESFAEILSGAMDALGVTPGEAAAALHRMGLKINRSTLNRWAKGEVTPSLAKIEVVRHLPDAIGLSPAEKENFLRAAGQALGFPLVEEPRAQPVVLPHRLHFGADDLPPFAGREVELAELQRLVLRRQSVLITGLGGMGKTRLAQELLRTCAGDFHHGCECLAITSGQDDVQVLRNVAHLLGVDLSPEVLRSDNRRLALDDLSQRLHRASLLFLVDGVEATEQVRDLVGWLRSITWVFTARRVSLKRVGVHQLHLPLPSTNEAAAIFRAHLPAAPIPDRNDERLVGRVVDKVGRLPFALRLAAAVLGNDQVASVAELDAWLDAGRLARAGSPTRKLERLFDGMLKSLSSSARQTLLLCGVFPNPTIRLTTAQSVGEAAGLKPVPGDWQELVDYSLIEQPDDGHVTLHARLHDHIRQLLPADRYFDRLQKGFTAHYVALAEKASEVPPGTERDYAALIPEEPNLLAAAEALHAARDWTGMRRIWPTLSGHLWVMQNQRAYEVFDHRCLEAAQAMGDEAWAARLRSELGYVKLEEKDWSAAEALFRQAQAYYDAAPDRKLDQARLRRYRAQAALGIGQFEQALALLAEAEGLLDSSTGATDEVLGRMLIYSARMTAYHRRGELTAAETAGRATEQLHLALNPSNPWWGYGEFRVELGDILFRLGKIEEAARRWRIYLASREGLPPTPDDAEAQLRLAWLNAKDGTFEPAVQAAEAARETFFRFGKAKRYVRAAEFLALIHAGADLPELDAFLVD